MTGPLVLRDAVPAGVVVVVRLGEKTLEDDHLTRAVKECHGRWGIWGFSVLEVPGGDYAELVRLRPFVGMRRRLHLARAEVLVNFRVPTAADLRASTLDRSASGADPRTVHRSTATLHWTCRESRLDWTRRPGTVNGVESGAPYDLWFDPNGVDGDLVVECWISHGPRSGDRGFDPQPGNEVLVSDDEEPPIPASVLRREGDRVWARIDIRTDVQRVANAHDRSRATG